MLEKKDIKYLTRLEGRRGLFTIAFLGLMMLFGIVMFVLNQIRASEIASEVGLDLRGLWNSWFQEFEAGKQYSGTYLLAVQRLEASLMSSCITIMGVLFLLICVLDRRRKRRIAAILKEHGIWKI